MTQHRKIVLKASTSVAMLCAAALSGTATAQDTPAAGTQVAAADDVIIVTGSRIASPVATASSPIQIVGEEQIENAGVTNIQSLLLENPVFGTPTFSRTNTAFATSGAGVATVDLRNLGVDRTLVLVNGRRFVSGVPGSNAVDLNVIPTQFLERVDVLTGGASAVYGSDAVAGVVNFIYKKNFEGIEADFRQGFTTRGDGSDHEANILVGKNFGDGRGNIMAFAGWSKEGTILKRDRFTEAGRMDVDQTSAGEDPNYFEVIRPFYSGFAPQGRYYVPNPLFIPDVSNPDEVPSGITFTYDRNGTLRPCARTNGGTCDLTNTPFEGSALDGTEVGPDGFNRSEYRYLAVPVERYVAALSATYEFSPALNFFFEGNYARTQVSTVIEPYPLASDDINDETGGQIAVESLVNGTLYRNPFVPDAIYDLATDTDGDGLRDIFFDKRLADFGGRTSSAKRDTFRITAGFNGELSSRLNYEAYALYGETKEAQTGSGQFNSLKFREALNAIQDVNDIDGDGNVSEIICANPVARAGGCVPANIYGTGSLTPATGYLAAPQQLDTKVTQFVAGLNVSAQLFSLGFGADDVSVAAGVEYRKETSASVFDELSQLGLNGGNALPATFGRFNVKEAYAETIIPIVEDKPFMHLLNLRGAVRASDYSTVGSTFSYNYGGEWAPTEDVRFRVIKARSVRAPNISELFSPPQQDFPSGLSDPCEGVKIGDSGTLAQNCLAAPGVRDNAAANPDDGFSVSQSDKQGITSFGGGNINLQEEKSDSFTAGVVINPRSIPALRNLVLTVDYFNIKIKDAIVETPLPFILEQCYSGGDTSLCDFVIRRPAAQGANSAGSIDEVNNGPTNSGGVKTSGIDITVAYTHNFGDTTVGVRGSYTHLLTGYSVPLPGSDADQFRGEIGASIDRFTTNLTVARKAVQFSLTGTYVGQAYLDDQLTGSTPGGNKAYSISPEFYLDAQVRLLVQDRMEFFFGADNLLDNDPPFLADLQDEAAGIDTASGTYDALGRRYYVGAKIRF